jgi:bacillolysin
VRLIVTLAMNKPMILVMSGLLLAAASARAADLRMQAVSPGDVRPLDARIDAMLADGRLNTVYVREDVMIEGRIHERLAQRHKGLEVWGADVTRQRGPSGTVTIFGRLVDVPADLELKPHVSPEGARAIAAQIAGGEVPERDAELLVYPKADGTVALAWHIAAWGREGLWAYMIDARSGQELFRYNALQAQTAESAIGTGVLGDKKKMSVGVLDGRHVTVDVQRPPRLITYDMKGDYNRTLAFFSGFVSLTANDVASDDDTNWTDGPVVDAHTYAGWVYDYYFKRHGRKGLDGADLPMRSIVHPARREQYPTLGNVLPSFYLNAFWNTADRVMLYGVGAPVPVNVGLGLQNWNHLAGSLDVVAHELTHGVTQFSSNLIYAGESGALNEAFSDIMSAGVQFYYNYPSANYVVGDDVVTPVNAAPGGIRSLSNPVRFLDPDHYSVRYTGTADGGGVHTNSMIPGHAFYLAIEGGTNRVSGQRVTGVGAANREKIEKIFFRAFTRLLGRSSSFSDARAATIASARDLYTASDPSVTAVTQAWDAVGVQ